MVVVGPLYLNHNLLFLLYSTVHMCGCHLNRRVVCRVGVGRAEREGKKRVNCTSPL